MGSVSAQPAIHSPATEAWLAAHGRIAHRATWLGTAGTVGAVVIIVAVVATSGSDGPGGIAIAALVAVSIAGLAGLAILIFGLDAIHHPGSAVDGHMSGAWRANMLVVGLRVV